MNLHGHGWPTRGRQLVRNVGIRVCGAVGNGERRNGHRVGEWTSVSGTHGFWVDVEAFLGRIVVGSTRFESLEVWTNVSGV